MECHSCDNDQPPSSNRVMASPEYICLCFLLELFPCILQGSLKPLLLLLLLLLITRTDAAGVFLYALLVKAGFFFF